MHLINYIEHIFGDKKNFQQALIIRDGQCFLLVITKFEKIINLMMKLHRSRIIQFKLV